MILLLDGNASMEFWRTIYHPNKKLESAACVPAQTECAETAADIQRMAPAWLTDEYLQAIGGKITAFTMRGIEGRRRSSKHSIRIWPCEFPPESFYECRNGVYVSSPCFTFLQMAQKLDFAELIAYGNELCGTYSFDPNSKRGIRKRKHPLVSKKKLEGFLEAAVGCPGRRVAKTALRYIVEGSASPQETLDVMLLCLPYHFGGYSLRLATMNAPVSLKHAATVVSHLTECKADISWPPITFDIEYQGRFDHLSPEDFDADRARINALRMMGFEVIELTHGQVEDWQAFEQIALHAAKVIGHRVPSNKRGLTPERHHLRKTLRAWNLASGRPCNK